MVTASREIEYYRSFLAASLRRCYPDQVFGVQGCPYLSPCELPQLIQGRTELFECQRLYRLRCLFMLYRHKL